MAKVESQGLEKKQWTQNFQLIGKAIVNDSTYKINERAEKSDWIYNSLNLGIDCGEKHGIVYADLMGGYGAERDNKVYVHGRNEDGTDDFKNQFIIAWEDRTNEKVLAEIGDLCFLTAGLEKTTQDKIFYKPILTPYDFIAYVKENLKNETVVKVKGQLRYSEYNGNIQCRKEINYIALYDATPDQYKASFTQTILLTKDSCDKKSIDTDRATFIIDGYILEKFKEYNGYDLTENNTIRGGQFVPLTKRLEYAIPTAGREKAEIKSLGEKIIDTFFKVKKNTVTQITLSGDFIESGAVVKGSLDNANEDVKAMVLMGMLSEEELLSQFAGNGNKERRMVATLVQIETIEKDDGTKMMQQKRIDEKFSEEDLMPYYMYKKEESDESDEDVNEEVVPFEEVSEADAAWLKFLM